MRLNKSAYTRLVMNYALISKMLVFQPPVYHDTVPPEANLNFPADKLKRGGRDVPVYVKHSYPEVLQSRTDYNSFLPKIPGAADNYGMVYNKPETEAEKNMHELWMAKRRQEVEFFLNDAP